MAASSEIRFKIGADTSAVSSAFAKVQSMAAIAGKQIDKKISFKEAFKGMMMGLGIGSVDAIADAIVRPFQVGMERAKDILGMTTRLRDLTMQEIVAKGGRKTALDAMRKEVNDLSRDISDQERLVQALDTPVAKVNPMAASLLRDAEKELIALKIRQAEVQSKINIDVDAAKRATSEWSREQSMLQDLAQAELRDAGDREKIQIRLNHLQREYARLIRRGDHGTDKERQNLTQQFALQNQMKLLQEKSAQQLAAGLAGLGAALAGRDPNRAPKPRPRGRSEPERIADRGASFALQAEDALRTGKSPEFVASLAQKANRDLTAAGQKAERGANMVQKRDADALGGIFQKAVTELQEIRKNLTPSAVDKGGKK